MWLILLLLNSFLVIINVTCAIYFHTWSNVAAAALSCMAIGMLLITRN